MLFVSLATLVVGKGQPKTSVAATLLPLFAEGG